LIGTGRAWSGANSFFAWTLPQNEQITLINTLREKNVRIIRIFLATVDGGQAGSNALAANDIERYRVGSPYTDSDMLSRVDQFIKNVATYGGGRIKLIIALHDRYSLGCYSYKADAYVSKYGIPAASACSPPNDASKFYSNEQAKTDFVNRLRFLLEHVNPHYGQRWGSLSCAIFSFQIENESQGHMSI
jgi:mannan endo-1,4-beta-mannosidase